MKDLFQIVFELKKRQTEEITETSQEDQQETERKEVRNWGLGPSTETRTPKELPVRVSCSWAVV